MKDVMTIEELRDSIYARLPKIANKDILLQIHTLLVDVDQDQDWWDHLTQSQKEKIEKGLADLKAGRRSSHAEVMQKYGM